MLASGVLSSVFERERSFVEANRVLLNTRVCVLLKRIAYLPVPNYVVLMNYA